MTKRKARKRKEGSGALDDRTTWREGDLEIAEQPKGKTLAELDAEEQEKGEDQ